MSTDNGGIVVRLVVAGANLPGCVCVLKTPCSSRLLGARLVLASNCPHDLAVMEREIWIPN